MQDAIAWPLFAKAQKATRHHLRIFISKWLIGHLPTNDVMKKWKQRIHAKGPHYQYPHEDIIHLTTCSSETVSNYWTNSITKLDLWLAKKDTDHKLQEFNIEGLISWIQDLYRDELPTTHFPAHKQTAFQQQLNIGWFGFLAGFISPAIAHLQQRHYSDNSKETTGASWTSQLIQQIWHILYELWLLHNKTLHQKTIDGNHGINHLDYSVIVKYHIGALGLPSHFKGYFSQPLSPILAKDIEQKRNGSGSSGELKKLEK